MPIISPFKRLLPLGGKGGVSMSAGEAAIRAGNTVAWYDYTDTTTLTDVGGGVISRWNDKLGSGHDLLQANNAKRPLLTAEGVTGAGGDDYMEATFTLVQPEFIYCVGKWVTYVEYSPLFSGSTGDGYVYQRYARSGGNEQLRAGASLDSATNASLAENTFGIIRLLLNGASSKLIINNTAATTWNCGASNMGGVTIFSMWALGYYANAVIKELIVRNKSDSAGDEVAIYNYLAAKYGFATI